MESGHQNDTVTGLELLTPESLHNDRFVKFVHKQQRSRQVAIVLWQSTNKCHALKFFIQVVNCEVLLGRKF